MSADEIKLVERDGDFDVLRRGLFLGRISTLGERFMAVALVMDGRGRLREDMAPTPEAALTLARGGVPDMDAWLFGDLNQARDALVQHYDALERRLLQERRAPGITEGCWAGWRRP